jgi:peroxiredoxin/outer membrane lipoprotein-sorting protein
MVSLLWLVGAILLLPRAAAAQVDPQAERLLQRASALYRSLASGQFEGAVSTGRSALGQDRATPPSRFTLSFRRPSQARLEGRGPDDVVIMVNGASSWEYLPSRREFIRGRADWSLGSSQIARYQRLLDGVRRARVLWDEQVSFGGVEVACDVVEVEYVDPPVGEPRAATFWIAREPAVVVREVVLLMPPPSPDAAEVTATTAWSSARLNPDLPESLFTFSPSPDDREVTEFSSTAGPTLLGSAAPAATIEEPGRDSVTLADLKGRVVLLLFWTTQCETCVRTAEILDALQRRLATDGLVLVAAGPEPAERLRSFMSERGLAMRVVEDRDGALARQYRLEAIPTTFLIDRDGTVRERVNGARPEAEWRELLARHGLGGR